eukprot:CAMPEP_0171985426 /NCGR_PEP_ID=MMETSP0993-20121228/274343_1 /TAXON_ID=483369 /ORGANISM="non described non described, Strain CCMP2098" /LENGTH=967 /DNA_ID=CAMNT_0012638291 /DNA_START=19 /DNA_END=2922 /DNA_ORIENTATION=-
MMSGDDRVIRAANLQRSAMESTGVRNSSSSVIAGGTAFAEQIMTKSTTLRHSDSGEWAEVQKAAFTDWINSTLRERGAKVEEDLYTELADGTILYNLLEVLSGESLLKYGRLTGGKMRIQQIANCSLSFKFLAKHVKIVDIGPTDIVDGNPKRVLGLIWAIFVFYEVLSIPDVKSVSDLKAKILCWVKRRTLPFKAQGVRVTNLTSSFEDGKVFLALLADADPTGAPYRPTSDPVLNRKKAYRLAEELFGVPPLLHYEDARVFSYEQVMLTYLVELYNRLPREMDRTLATVMVYLKVSKWWAKVKADRRRQREATAMHKRTGREPSREQVDARIKADKQLGGGMSPSSNQNQNHNHNRHQPHHHHRPNPGDRTLATVMVYLKVSKWWAKVKADRRRQREATAMHKRTGREPSREQVDARIKADKQLGGGMSPSSNQNQNRHQPHHHHRPNPGLQDPALYPSSPSRVSFNDVHHHHSTRHSSGERPPVEQSLSSYSPRKLHTPLFGDIPPPSPGLQDPALYPSSPSRVSFNDVHHHYSNNRHTSNDHAHSGDLVPVEQSLSSYSPRKLHTPLLDAELLLINDSSNGGQAMREQPAVDYNRELRAPHAFPEYVCVVCVHGLRNLDQERAGDVGSLALECTSDNCLDQALTRGAAQTQSCYDSTVVKYGESVGWALTSAIVHVPASTSTSTSNCKLTLRVLGLDDEEMFSTRVPLPQTLTQAELLAPPNTSHPPTAAAGGAGGGGGLVDQLNSTPLEWVNSDGPGLAQCSYSVVKLHFRDLALVVKELCHAKDELSAVDEEAESLTQQAEAVLFSMGNSSGVRALNGEDGSDGTPYLGRLLQLIALDVNHDKAETHAELEERLERLEHENEGLRRAMRDETRRSVSAARQAEEWEDQMRAAAEQMAHERRAHVSEVREQEAAKEWAARQEELEAEAFVESSKQARGDDLRRLQARRELDEYRASLGLFGL